LRPTLKLRPEAAIIEGAAIALRLVSDFIKTSQPDRINAALGK
jgi:hypothetical protein